MSISIITGLTGSGKTYFMTREALKLSEKLPNVPILANYHVKDFPRKVEYFDNPNFLLNIEKAIVLIDDGAIWFNSRRWHEFSYDLQYKIINNRKDGLKIYVTTQYFDGIESTIRENCHYYYECTKLFGSGEFSEKVWGVIRARQYYPRLHDKIRRKPISSKYFFLKKKYVDLYDTYEKINPLVPKDKAYKKEAIKQHKKQEKKYKIIRKKRKIDDTPKI